MAPKAFKGKEKAKNPLSPSCPSAEQSGSTSSAGPTSDFASVEKHKKNLKFVSVTEESLHGLHDLDEQRSIRAHVMRDFLRQRSSDGQGKDLQPATMAEGPAQHITRFRLPNAKPRESASSGLRGQPTAGAAGNPGRRPNREVLPKTSPGVAATLLPREEDVPLHAPTTATFNQQKWHMQSNILANNASLSGGTSDPFSRLPIDASPETLELIHYCKFCPIDLITLAHHMSCPAQAALGNGRWPAARESSLTYEPPSHIVESFSCTCQAGRQ